MSVTDVNVIGITNSSVSMNGSRKYTVSYRVQTDNVDDQSLTAMTAVGIPSTRNYMLVGNDSDEAAYPVDYSASLQDQNGDRKTWIVLVNFAASIGQQNRRPQDNTDTTGGFYRYPWDMPARVSGHGMETQAPPVRTLPTATSTDTGLSKDILNTVGDVPPGLAAHTQHFSYPSLVIEKDFQNWPADLESYADTLNALTFFGKATGCWRMGFPTWSQLYIGDGTKYYNISFEFFYLADGWNNQKVRNAGYRELDSYLGVLVEAKDGEGLKVSEPVNLDQTGYRLPDDSPAIDINYHPYIVKDFAALGIPTSR